MILECVPDDELQAHAIALAAAHGAPAAQPAADDEVDAATTSPATSTSPTPAACSASSSTASPATRRRASTSSPGPRRSASARPSASATTLRRLRRTPTGGLSEAVRPTPGRRPSRLGRVPGADRRANPSIRDHLDRVPLDDVPPPPPQPFRRRAATAVARSRRTPSRPRTGAAARHRSGPGLRRRPPRSAPSAAAVRPGRPRTLRPPPTSRAHVVGEPLAPAAPARRPRSRPLVRLGPSDARLRRRWLGRCSIGRTARRSGRRSGRRGGGTPSG